MRENKKEAVIAGKSVVISKSRSVSLLLETACSLKQNMNSILWQALYPQARL